MTISLSKLTRDQYLAWLEQYKTVSPVAAALDADHPKYDAETANDADSDDPAPDDQDYGADDADQDDDSDLDGDPDIEAERATYREILAQPAY